MKQWIALTTALLVLGGCSKLNKANYDALEVGMTQAEVEAVIGTADLCEESMGAAHCTWGNDDKHIKVSFAADKAMLFSNKGLK